MLTVHFAGNVNSSHVPEQVHGLWGAGPGVWLQRVTLFALRFFRIAAIG